MLPVQLSPVRPRGGPVEEVLARGSPPQPVLGLSPPSLLHQCRSCSKLCKAPPVPIPCGKSLRPVQIAAGALLGFHVSEPESGLKVVEHRRPTQQLCFVFLVTAT